MKSLIRRAAALPFRAVPAPVRRRIVQVLITAASGGTPAEALRELLQIDTDVSGAIDQSALRYGDGVHAKHRLMRYHDFFVDRLSPGERVLDIGCGYGAVAHSMASRAGALVVGLDMSAENVRLARERFRCDGLSFCEGEAPRSLPEGPFDVVVMSNVLEHIERRIEFLAEVEARLRPSRWLLRVPMFDRDWRPSLRKELDLFPFSDPTHFTEYTRESFEREMADAGFAVRHLQINWGEIWAEVAHRN